MIVPVIIMIINAILLKFILSPAYCFHKKNKKKLFLSEFIRVEHFSLKKKKKSFNHCQ